MMRIPILTGISKRMKLYTKFTKWARAKKTIRVGVWVSQGYKHVTAQAHVENNGSGEG